MIAGPVGNLGQRRRMEAVRAQSRAIGTFLSAKASRTRPRRGAYKVWAEYAVWPEDYDTLVDERYWWDRFEIEGGPCPKTYRLLDEIDLGPTLQTAYRPRTRVVPNLMKGIRLPRDVSC